MSGDTYSFAPLRRGRQSGHRIPGAVGAALLALLTSTADASRAERRDTWPWALEVPAAVLVVYRPHIDAWKRNRLTFCAVVAAQATDSGEQAFGVIWGIARTTVDRPAGRVTLSALRLTRSNFPALLDNGVGHLRVAEAAEGRPPGDRTRSARGVGGGVSSPGWPVAAETSSAPGSRAAQRANGLTAEEGRSELVRLTKPRRK